MRPRPCTQGICNKFTKMACSKLFLTCTTLFFNHGLNVIAVTDFSSFTLAHNPSHLFFFKLNKPKCSCRSTLPPGQPQVPGYREPWLNQMTAIASKISSQFPSKKKQLWLYKLKRWTMSSSQGWSLRRTDSIQFISSNILLSIAISWIH